MNEIAAWAKLIVALPEMTARAAASPPKVNLIFVLELLRRAEAPHQGQTTMRGS